VYELSIFEIDDRIIKVFKCKILWYYTNYAIKAVNLATCKECHAIYFTRAHIWEGGLRFPSHFVYHNRITFSEEVIKIMHTEITPHTLGGWGGGSNTVTFGI
jgi:hypothetical protein